ncbi:MAG: glycosyl transferase family 8 [Micavibrio aeruginosavorus]|uniref:Glycosyl transferase family 8 n=1 Tax=Micavibrio aeruginosavorus TaxID=349221 RepID=A0A2W5N3G8_9BACT|nr:MAG: glycosyl transferase family 8 [Micavibrio aeruginosavorus]
MLTEWVHSVRAHPESSGMDIGILNAGMTEEELDYFRSIGCIVKETHWPAKIPASRIRGREYLKSCISRPFLPDYFPGYDIICWMDADIWVQDWKAVSLFLKGAERSALAVVPQADRALPKAARLSWIGPFPFKPKSFYYSNAKIAFSGKIARSLFPFITVNAGIFAMRSDAPHWKRWQELILKALEKGKVFTAEQLTLGMLIYLEKYKVEFLPSWCNWRCTTKPCWDEKLEKFVEPYLPHEPIGIMHLSGLDAARVDRSVKDEILLSEPPERRISLSLRYPALDGEKIKPEGKKTASAV